MDWETIFRVEGGAVGASVRSVFKGPGRGGPVSLLACVGLLLSGCLFDGSSRPVRITTQPADQTVVQGSTASFSVVAENAEGYQWQRSTDGGSTFQAISGATQSLYVTPASQLGDSGQRFRVVASRGNQSVTSSAASLTVNAAVVAPAISAQPADQVVVAGAAASFSVTATGTSLAYQWERSNDNGATYANVSGATGVTLTLPATALGDNGASFRVRVSNSAGNIVSSTARLTVTVPPVAPQITSHPVDVSVITPAPGAFSVSVAGTPAPTLQWQLSTDGGTTWSNIAGATGPGYTTPATVGTDNGRRYRVVATNSAGSATSNGATLTVSVAQLPAFTTQPANANVSTGQTAQFSAVVAGVPTPSLQWQKSTDGGGTWANINGATSASYTTGATVSGDNGSRYRVVATNSAGVTNSAAATLTVTTVYAWSTALYQHVDVGNTSEYADYVDFAMNDAGNAIAIWTQNNGSGANLWANRFNVGTGTWGTPQLIETQSEGVYAISASSFPEGPRIAMNADGSAIAAWVHSPSLVVWVSRYTVAGGWSTAVALETQAAGQRSEVPRVAIDGTGNAHVVWHRWDGSTYRVWASRFTVGGNWSTPAVVANNAAYPSVALNAGGKGVVAWNQLDTDPSRYTDVAAAYFDGSTLAAGVGLSLGASVTFSSARPEAGVDAAGNAIVAWKELNGTETNIRASRYSAGSWSPSITLDQSTDAALSVNLAVNANGEAIAAWYRLDASFHVDIYAARFRPATGWEPEALVENFSQDAASPTRVAIDPAGNSMVMMGMSANPTPGRLKVNQAPAGAAWTGVVNLDGLSFGQTPATWRIAMDGSGRAMAMWVQEGQSGPATRVWYKRYQ